MMDHEIKEFFKESINEIAGAVDVYTDAFEKGFTGLKDRVERLEAGADRPQGADHGSFSRDDHEHKDRFLNWLRRPADEQMKRQLSEAQSEMEHKTTSVVIGTDSQGGYAVPAVIARQIEEQVVQQNPFRRLCRVDTVGTTSYSALVSHNEAGSGWVGEAGTRSQTDTSTLVQCQPTFGTVYAHPQASEEAMQDIFFDIQAWLTREAADAFSAAEATAIVSGNGTNKPTGFLNTTPVTTDDNASPRRAATTLEYFPYSYNSPFSLDADDLIDLSMSLLDGYYASNKIAWVMRRSTAQKIRRMKDTYGQYLWQTSIQAGQPDMLLGYPVYFSNAMQADTAGNYPIAFGAWDRAYLLADRVGTMQITVDNNITTPGYVKFYMRRRVGGKVLNNQAVKVLKNAAS